MAILSEKRQKCFGLRRKDVRMRAIICDDDGRFAKKLEQLIMQYYRNMGMTIDTTVVTNPQNLLKRNDLANFDIAFLDADMKPIDGIEVGRALRKRKPKIIIVFVFTMFAKGKVIACVGHTLDKLGEKERKTHKCAVCPIIGFQPRRPERSPTQRDAK